MDCKRCGTCCSTEVCQIGVMAFNTDVTPCPGLVNENGIHSCMLAVVEEGEGLDPIIAEALAIGNGCTNEEMCLGIARG